MSLQVHAPLQPFKNTRAFSAVLADAVGVQSWPLPCTSRAFWPILVGRNHLESIPKIVQRVLSAGWAASLWVSGLLAGLTACPVVLQSCTCSERGALWPVAVQTVSLWVCRSTPPPRLRQGQGQALLCDRLHFCGKHCHSERCCPSHFMHRPPVRQEVLESAHGNSGRWNLLQSPRDTEVCISVLPIF